MAPYIVLVTALSSHYITYVITRSEFPPVLWLRDRVFDRWANGWPAYLVTCSFCTAFYVAAGVVLGAELATSVPLPILLWWLCAAIAGTLVEVVDAIRSITVRSQ